MRDLYQPLRTKSKSWFKDIYRLKTLKFITLRRTQDKHSKNKANLALKRLDYMSLFNRKL